MINKNIFYNFNMKNKTTKLVFLLLIILLVLLLQKYKEVESFNVIFTTDVSNWQT